MTVAIFLGSLLLAMALGIPIAYSLLLSGVALMVHLDLFDAQILAQNVVNGADSFPLLAVPFFMLAGEIMNVGGLSRRIVDLAITLVGHLRGGLGYVAILAAVLMAALSGSAVADTAALASLLLPMMVAAGHDKGRAGGLIASAGIIAPIIPPSIGFVIFGVAANVSISKLFLAGIFPGLLMGVGLAITWFFVARKEGNAPPPRASRAERLAALKSSTWALFLPVIILVGLKFGFFTPTEAAAIGTVGALFFAVWLGGMRWDGLVDGLYGTAEATAMIFLILLGADVLNVFLALTQMPGELARMVGSSGLPPLAVMFAILGIYVVLGCLMDSLSMILLTMPIFLPIVMGLDYWGLDPTEKSIWFGILALMVVEIGLITPPVGMNVYIINRLARDVPMSVTFKGVVPFLVSDALRVMLLVFLPILSLWLVRRLG